jgi:hypothetical protein
MKQFCGKIFDGFLKYDIVVLRLSSAALKL